MSAYIQALTGLGWCAALFIGFVVVAAVFFWAEEKYLSTRSSR